MVSQGDWFLYQGSDNEKEPVASSLEKRWLHALKYKVANRDLSKTQDLDTDLYSSMNRGQELNRKEMQINIGPEL